MLRAVVLTLANVLADLAIGSPVMVLPQLMADFGTGEAAWLNAGALLAGAVWSPLLAKSADLYGKRRILLAILLLSCLGAVICYLATNVVIFLIGRFLQGAAFAAVFVTVALAAEIYSAGVAMSVVGVVTSASSLVGIVEPFVMTPIIAAFGHRSVFLVAAVLAGLAALSVQLAIPESPIRATGRVDVLGALLLGGGLAAVLASLTGAPVALLVVGVGALGGWLLLARRATDPIIDIRALHRPILLTLLAVVLAAGAFRSMLHLIGMTGGDDVAVLLAAPNLGIVIGGAAAGWAAGRFGPARALLGGIVIGTVATAGMWTGVSVLWVAVACGVSIGVAAGAVGASGYNLATSIEPPERHGTTAGLVSVMTALGAVTFTFAGNEVLTTMDDGVHRFVLFATAVFALALIPALRLVRFAGVR